MKLIRIKEDSNFLQDHRTNCKIYMDLKGKELPKKRTRSLRIKEERSFRASLPSATICISDHLIFDKMVNRVRGKPQPSDDVFIPTQ